MAEPRQPSSGHTGPAPERVFRPAERLAELNRYFAQARARVQPVGEGDGHAFGQPAAAPGGLGCVGQGARQGPAELSSVARFRETWSRVSADKQVEQALVRAPENAGPLNSHMLVLRSLALMRELSPDYVRRFMSHVDTLQWLDQASNQLKAPAVKPTAVKMKAARPGHAGKPATAATQKPSAD